MIIINEKVFNNNDLHIILYQTKTLKCHIAFKDEEYVQELKDSKKLLIKVDDEIIVNNSIKSLNIINRLEEISDIEYIHNGRMITILLGDDNIGN